VTARFIQDILHCLLARPHHSLSILSAATPFVTINSDGNACKGTSLSGNILCDGACDDAQCCESVENPPCKYWFLNNRCPSPGYTQKPGHTPCDGTDLISVGFPTGGIKPLPTSAGLFPGQVISSQIAQTVAAGCNYLQCCDPIVINPPRPTCAKQFFGNGGRCKKGWTVGFARDHVTLFDFVLLVFAHAHTHNTHT
jgi:hypothetical protein